MIKYIIEKDFVDREGVEVGIEGGSGGERGLQLMAILSESETRHSPHPAGSYTSFLAFQSLQWCCGG